MISEPSELAPSMAPAEVVAYRRVLAGRRRLFEFGCGGSTLLAIQLEIPRITSVDSDPAWLERLRQDPQIGAREREGSLTLIHGDIGPVRGWGRPVEDKPRPEWRAYWSALDEETAKGVDIVLVDGRFRVACALNALLLLRPGALVAIHDYWNRPKYQVVGPFGETVEKVDTLVVLRRRPDADLEAMRALLERHALDWR